MFFNKIKGGPGTPASSTTKTGRHDIAEILLKVALNTKNQIHKIIILICSLIRKSRFRLIELIFVTLIKSTLKGYCLPAA